MFPWSPRHADIFKPRQKYKKNTSCGEDMFGTSHCKAVAGSVRESQAKEIIYNHYKINFAICFESRFSLETCNRF